MADIKIPLTDSTIVHKCPFCSRDNNFKFGDTCLYVDRVTVKRVVIYKATPIARVVV